MASPVNPLITGLFSLFTKVWLLYRLSFRLQKKNILVNGSSDSNTVHSSLGNAESIASIGSSIIIHVLFGQYLNLSLIFWEGTC